MVQRLHDQNVGKAIPSYLNETYVRKQLSKLIFPVALHKLSAPGRRQELSVKRRKYGHAIKLSQNSIFTAERCTILKDKIQKFNCRNEYHSLYITEGSGLIKLIGSEFEPIYFEKNDALLFIPGSKWQVINTSKHAVTFSHLVVDRYHAL